MSQRLLPLIMILCGAAFGAAPVVEYVNISRQPDSLLVDIEYKVSDADGDAMTISVVGVDVQYNRIVPMNTLSGDGADGETVTSGVHTMTWDAGQDWPGNVTDNFQVRLTASDSLGSQYMVIDVSAGPAATSYPVEFVDELTRSDEDYRTNFIVLVRIPAGTFQMGSPDAPPELGRDNDETQHNVTFSKAFYIGKFELTQYQWLAVMNTYPSASSAPMLPVENVSWNVVRGGEWPGGTKAPAGDSFIAVLRQKTGLLFDLPTEAQWEYACRAGTTRALNNDTNLISTTADPNLNILGRYSNNSGGNPGIVGGYQPNAAELFDMHGNVGEWVLDWYGSYQSTAVDPTGPTDGTSRVVRGGSFKKIASWCRSAARYYRTSPGSRSSDIGFRLAAPWD